MHIRTNLSSSGNLRSQAIRKHNHQLSEFNSFRKNRESKYFFAMLPSAKEMLSQKTLHARNRQAEERKQEQFEIIQGVPK